MALEEFKRRAVYAWALYFLEGIFLGIGLPILPYLVSERCLEGYDDSSDHQVLLLMSGVVASYYGGRILSSSLVIPWREYKGSQYKFSFAVSSLVSIPLLILFGYSSNIVWVLVTRFCTGFMSGYCGNLALNIEYKPYNYSAWIIGVSMSSFLVSILYATSHYRGQPIHTFTSDLQKHPATCGASASVFLIILVIIRVRLKETSKEADKSSEIGAGDSRDDASSAAGSQRRSDHSSWEIMSVCNPVFEDIDLSSFHGSPSTKTSRPHSYGADSHSSNHADRLSNIHSLEAGEGLLVRHTDASKVIAPTTNGSTGGSSLASNNTSGRGSGVHPTTTMSTPTRTSSTSQHNRSEASAGTPARQRPAPEPMRPGIDPSVSSHRGLAGVSDDAENGGEGKGYDPSELQVPSRYIRGCGDYEEALRRWRLTLQWRKEFDVDSILNEPQPFFDVIKRYYPHYIHGHSKSGHPVYYEQIGRVDTRKLQELGVDVHRLLRYYVFITEYIWTHVEPDQDFGQLVTILDVQGVGVADLMGDALEFLKEASKVIQSHYVERCHKMFIVNAPFFFNMLWRIISPMLHENTRRKITILGSDWTEILKVIDASQLPVQYGGTGPPLGTSVDEANLRSFVDKLNAKPPPLSGSSHGVPREVDTSPHEPLSVSVGRGKARSSSLESEAVTMRRYVEESDSSEFNSYHSRRTSRSNTVSSDAESADLNKDGVRGGGFRFGLGVLSSAIGVVVKRVSPIFINSARKAPEAHLGSENAYVFDETAGKWVIRGAAVDMDAVYEDDTEKRLVRAIQAAQGLVEESEFGDDEVEVDLYGPGDGGQANGISSRLLEQSKGRLGANPFRTEGSSRIGEALAFTGEVLTGGQVDPSASQVDKRYRLEGEETAGGSLKLFFQLATIYIVWRGVLTCLLETFFGWMFLSEFYTGLGMAPYSVGFVVIVACILVLIGKIVWMRRALGGSAKVGGLLGYTTVRAYQLATNVFLVPQLMLLLFLIPFAFDSLGMGPSRFVVIVICVAIVVGCLIISALGLSSICELQPNRIVWLYSRTYLAECIGAVMGLLMLRAFIWLPFLVCFFLCLCLSYLSNLVPQVETPNTHSLPSR